MKIVNIKIGKNLLKIKSDRDLMVLGGLQQFIYTVNPLGLSIININIHKMPLGMRIFGEFCGKDGLMEYYRDGKRCLSRDIPVGEYSACIVEYSVALHKMDMYINDWLYPNAISSYNKVLQLLPLREFLANQDALLLHSSQVRLQGLDSQQSIGESLIFTAKSGTGKTTQAKLWKNLEGADILCNDRTLFYKDEDNWFTTGYFVDGSEPVYSVDYALPAAMICLAQGSTNQVERLKPSRALALLMSQTVADDWNPKEKTKLQWLWLDILQKIPVYLLACRPDSSAVECLKERLTKDNILVWRDENEIN